MEQNQQIQQQEPQATNINLPAEIQQEANQYGIQLTQAASLLGSLPQITAERDALVDQYNEVIRMDIESVATQKAARELRLKIKDNRTKGLAVWHKTTKDYFLKGGQFVDAIKRKEEAVNVRMEDALEQIEKHLQLKIERERQENRQKRAEALKPYMEFVPFGIDLGVLDEQEYLKVFNGAKLQYERKLEEQRREQEKLVEQQRLKEIYNKNKEQLMPYMLYIQDFNSIDFQNITEAEIQTLIQGADEKRLQHQKELEEAKKQAEQRERELEVERKKRDEENRKMRDKLLKEQQEKKKLQEELEQKQKLEREQEEQRKREERRLQNSSDTVLLQEVVAPKIENLFQEFPEMKGEEAKQVVEEAKAYLVKIANYVKQQAQSLVQ
jgi:hypothetical protein